MVCLLYGIPLKNIKNPQIENRNCGMRKSENGIKKIDEVFVSNISNVCATDEKLFVSSSSMVIL